MARLGGIDLSEIMEVAREPVSDIAGSTVSERFVRTVTTLVERRHEAGEVEGLTVFLRSQTINDDVRGRDNTPAPFVCNGSYPISQRIVLTDALLGRAYILSITADLNFFETLEAHGLGSHPALIIDWRGGCPKAMLWPQGVTKGDPVTLYLSDHEITPVEMKAILDDFYKARLRTPQTITEGHGQRVWGDPNRGHPASRPEEQIQGILIAFLRGRLRHDVRPEIPNAEGRLDIQISARLLDTNGERIVKKIWILELKALTDKTSTGEDVHINSVIAGLQKGVTQAYCYREAEYANRAALCCYDMRKDDMGDPEVFAPIEEEAGRNSVFLWRWFLFRSSHAHRTAAAQAKAVTSNAAASGLATS